MNTRNSFEQSKLVTHPSHLMSYMKNFSLLKLMHQQIPWLRPFPLQPIPCTGQPLHGVPLVSTILDPLIPYLPLLTSGVPSISDLLTHHSTTLPIARIGLHQNHIKVFAKFMAFKVTQPNNVPPSN